MPYRLVCEECGHNATITDTAPLCNRCYNRLVQEAEEQDCNEPYPLYDWEQDALAPEDADPGMDEDYPPRNVQRIPGL